MLVDADKVKEKMAAIADRMFEELKRYDAVSPLQLSACATAIRQADLSDCAVEGNFPLPVTTIAQLDSYREQIESQAAEIARLKEDAERYRWLREVDCTFEYCKYISDRFNKGVALGRLDAAIDSAKGKS